MDLDITADAAGDVTIKENKINIITNVATTGNDVTVVVKNSNGNTVGTVSAVSGTGLSVSDGVVTASGATFNGTYTIDWTNKNAAGEVIGAGNTKVYTVQVSFGNSVGTDKSLTVELEEYLAWRDDEVTSDITGQADLIDDLSGSFEIDNK
jgi:membrane-bound inhibitor of C-type lysozyme